MEPNGDYAGLVKELHDAVDCYHGVEIWVKVADAIEALVAELKAQKEYNDVLTCKKLGDEARSAERYWEARWRDEAKENDNLKAARLAPVGSIEHDPDDSTREYIPLPGGWEIQTKGNGSSYRLLDKKTGERHMILAGDAPFVQDFVTRMAKEVNAARLAPAPTAQPPIANLFGATNSNYSIENAVFDKDGQMLSGKICPYPASVETSTDTLTDGLAVTMPDGEGRVLKVAPVDDEKLVEIAARRICLERAAPDCRCKDDGICKAPVENLCKHNDVWSQARAAIAAVRPHIEAATLSDLTEFSKHKSWSLNYKRPFYCDDDDQEQCWVVYEEIGPINDRDWNIIGKGDTVAEAIASAIKTGG